MQQTRSSINARSSYALPSPRLAVRCSRQPKFCHCERCLGYARKPVSSHACSSRHETAPVHACFGQRQACRDPALSLVCTGVSLALDNLLAVSKHKHATPRDEIRNRKSRGDTLHIPHYRALRYHRPTCCGSFHRLS